MSNPKLRPLRRLLIANRGEIACRVLSTARELEIETFTLYTSDDTSHTIGSTKSIQLSSPASYLNISELISIVKKYNIDAVHPGYGFLSENAEFSRRMWKEANAIVIGPGWEVLERTGDKLAAKALAHECAVPILAASDKPTSDFRDVEQIADSIGYPVIVKAADGGGGRGIRIVQHKRDLKVLMQAATRESPSGKVFIEKAAVDGFRHIEVQVVGDGYGLVTHLWERECSIQRRFQKVVEFAPSSIRDRKLVVEVIESALRMARKIEYSSLGTFEFLVRESSREFYFLEINPRIQVEHTVTEAICPGLDLVKLQFEIAAGQRLAELVSLHDSDAPVPELCAIQARITAEDVAHEWALSVGKVSTLLLPSGNGIRVETHMLVNEPTIIKTDFDSLLAKVIVTSRTWPETVAKAMRAMADIKIIGVATSIEVIRGILSSKDFHGQKCDTQWLECTLTSVIAKGQEISRRIDKSATSRPSGSQPLVLVSGAANTTFRKGDTWSLMLTTDASKTNGTKPAIVGHLEITKVLRNDFPQSLAAGVIYTTAHGESTPYAMSIASSGASAGAIASASKHRRGNASNSNHVVVPFPGQLMEITVEVDDLIAKGDLLAVVRQMKMELEIRASKSGRIVWCYEGDEGDDVGEGILLCELENLKL